MAEWVVVENGEITEYYDAVPKNWRNISGLVLSKDDLEFMKSVGWYPVVKEAVDYNASTHFIARYSYEINSDSVTETPVIELAPSTPFGMKKEAFMIALRLHRNQLLRDTDWTQAVDVQEMMSIEEKEKWKSYRAQLRDLPALYESTSDTDFSKIIWPSINVN